MDQKIYIKSIRGYLDIEKKKAKNPKKYKSIIIIIDMKKLKKERRDLNYEWYKRGISPKKFKWIEC